MTDLHTDKILILDFGAQYTQLIARRIRELGVYCEVWAWDHDPDEIATFAPKGIILSGGPESTTVQGAPTAPRPVVEARKSAGEGMSVSVRVEPGGRRRIKKKKHITEQKI